jgi:ketosteroid isomerase-like protein
MKKKYLFKTIVIAIILLTIGCKKEVQNNEIPEETPNFDLEEAKKEVISVGEIFVIAINKGDSISAANCYSKDAKIMRPNNNSIIGKENINKAFNHRLESGKLRFSMKTVAVWGEGNMLTAEEEWMLSNPDGKIIDEGKSLEIYKKEDGKWKIFRDCFNSNLPCPK